MCLDLIFWFLGAMDIIAKKKPVKYFIILQWSPGPFWHFQAREVDAHFYQFLSRRTVKTMQKVTKGFRETVVTGSR